MPANQKSESRSLTARGAATRSRIVDAAADLIYEHGVERTSLDDVMAASGVSKSQLYHYFADKDALVLEVIALQAERVLAAQQPHLEALDFLRALRAWGQAIIRLNEQVHMGRAARWDHSRTSWRIRLKARESALLASFSTVDRPHRARPCEDAGARRACEVCRSA